MRVITAAEVDAALDFPALIDALRAAFAGDMTVPVRHHHAIERAGAATATLLLMPAWTGSGAGSFVGTKIVSVFPDNGKRGLPSIFGTYLLMSGETGETFAAMDGTRLTAWRTAAASALASSYLARKDASRMLMIGSGALAPFLVRAHASVRPIRQVTLWNHNIARAKALALELERDGFDIVVSDDLEAAVRGADIISCATLSSQPLVRGQWLSQGVHLDLVGAFNPAMRESDDECVRRADIYVDTRGGALKEGGDIVQPMADGIISKSDILGDLFELCRGSATVDRAPGAITLFKSVGSAIEDLAAAILVWQRTSGAAGVGSAPTTG